MYEIYGKRHGISLAFLMGKWWNWWEYLWQMMGYHGKWWKMMGYHISIDDYMGKWWNDDGFLKYPQSSSIPNDGIFPEISHPAGFFPMTSWKPPHGDSEGGEGAAEGHHFKEGDTKNRIKCRIGFSIINPKQIWGYHHFRKPKFVMFFFVTIRKANCILAISLFWDAWISSRRYP